LEKIMRNFNVFLGLALAAASALAQGGAPASQAPKPESLHDRASYVIGLNMARNLKAQEVPVNAELIIQGLRDGMAGTSVLTDAEIQAAMQEFQQEMTAKQESKMKELADKNKKEGEAFLEANKGKPGVKTTASGLQYEIVTEGSGASPKATDEVTVHYKGTLIDGTVFDSSYQRNQPATFTLNQVIPGWTEGVQLTKPGGKIKLYIPSALGYGERGAGGTIGPNAVLLFEVELLSVQAKPEAPKPEGEKPPGGR
jgi:FKBP-type peptidyl-prolyl cis-trans isomerase FklB